MAEFVQQALEAMLPELEQLQRVQLFSKEEVRSLLKRRKRFEYSIQKQRKRKEDFLEYIQYEVAVLSLIEVRREKLGYPHKKDEIDYAVARRINRLYKILEHRFGDDVKIWLSHIDFLKRMKWNASVGKIFRAMLQVHVYNVGLWISAAKYEFEEADSPENARKILFEGLRFNKKSEELYREYFRFELLYVEGLRQRSEVLGISEVAEENRDEVLEGKLVAKVFEQVATEMPEPSFLSSLLAVAAECKEGESISDTIEKHLLEKHSRSPVTWDTLARFALHGKPGAGSTNLSTRKCLEKCIALYDKGLSEVPIEEKSNLHSMYMDTLTGLINIIPDQLSAWLTRTVVTALENGDEQAILKESSYKLWMDLVDNKEEIVRKPNFPSKLLNVI